MNCPRVYRCGGTNSVAHTDPQNCRSPDAGLTQPTKEHLRCGTTFPLATRSIATSLSSAPDPAGLVAAITLARQGIDVVVVERHAGTSPFPKATGISVRTMEIFRTWGIEHKIRAGAMSVDPVMTISETLVGTPKTVLPFGFPTDEQALAVSPTTACCCPQDHLEPVLLEQLRNLGGDVRFGVELVDLQQDDSGVTAQIRNGATSRSQRIRGRYLIGADGPRSFTRGAARH